MEPRKVPGGKAQESSGASGHGSWVPTHEDMHLVTCLLEQRRLVLNSFLCASHFVTTVSNAHNRSSK